MLVSRISPFRYAVLCWVSQSCLTLCDPVDYSPSGSSVPGDSPGKNTAVGCHALLQGIFPTQRLNPGLPHCRRLLYHLSHQKSTDKEQIADGRWLPVITPRNSATEFTSIVAWSSRYRSKGFPEACPEAEGCRPMGGVASSSLHSQLKTSQQPQTPIISLLNSFLFVLLVVHRPMGQSLLTVLWDFWGQEPGLIDLW